MKWQGDFAFIHFNSTNLERTELHLIKTNALKNSCSDDKFETLPHFLFPLLLQVAFSSLPQDTFLIITHCSGFRCCPTIFTGKLVYYLKNCWFCPGRFLSCRASAHRWKCRRWIQPRAWTAIAGSIFYPAGGTCKRHQINVSLTLILLSPPPTRSKKC